MPSPTFLRAPPAPVRPPKRQPLIPTYHRSPFKPVTFLATIQEIRCHTRVADALVNRKLCAGNHFCRVLGGDQVGVLVLRPVRHKHRKRKAPQHVDNISAPNGGQWFAMTVARVRKRLGA